jgi:phospholipid N-methyltransferase
MVRDIFEIYRHLLNPGGVCSFFEYALLRKARRFMAGTADDRRRIVAVSEVVAEYVDRYCYKRDFVFMNLPPAVVHHIRFTPAAVL